MLFEFFTLLFHTKSVRDNLSVILSLKDICKDSMLAYKQTRSSIFVNALMLHRRMVDFGHVFVEYGVEPEHFTEMLSILSEKLLMYEDPWARLWGKVTFTNTYHLLEDPFYPDKGNNLPGQVLRFRKQLQKNKYLDSIINLASKPKKTFTYY